MDTFPEGTRRYMDQKAQQNCHAEPSPLRDYGYQILKKVAARAGLDVIRGRRGGGGWALRHRRVRQTLKNLP